MSGKDCDMIKAMKNQIEISVEWGDIDQAAIVFYPNYFKWFDIGTRHLLDAAGVSYSTLQSELGLVGLPLVEASSRFLSPIRFGDTGEARKLRLILAQENRGNLPPGRSRRQMPRRRPRDSGYCEGYEWATPGGDAAGKVTTGPAGPRGGSGCAH